MSQVRYLTLIIHRNNFNKLPNETTKTIFDLLKVQELIPVFDVCKKFRDVVKAILTEKSFFESFFIINLESDTIDRLRKHKEFITTYDSIINSTHYRFLTNAIRGRHYVDIMHDTIKSKNVKFFDWLISCFRIDKIDKIESILGSYVVEAINAGHMGIFIKMYTIYLKYTAEINKKDYHVPKPLKLHSAWPFFCHVCMLRNDKIGHRMCEIIHYKNHNLITICSYEDGRHVYHRNRL